MRVFFLTVTLAFAGLLGGCAVTNTQAQIDRSAATWMLSKLCAQAGMLDRETAAKGMAWATSQIYSGETPRLQARAQEIYERWPKPTKKDCDNLGIDISALSMSKSSSSSASNNSYMPKYTTCNKVFGQMNCVTY